METPNKKEILKLIAIGVMFFTIVYAFVYLIGISIGAI